MLEGGGTVTLQGSTLIQGSILGVGGSLNIRGTASVQGDIWISDAMLSMLDVNNTPSTLTIEGDLNMQDSIFKFNVYANTINVSDSIVASTITLAGNCTSDCVTHGVRVPGAANSYTPLSSILSDFVGEFDTYNWMGTKHVWGVSYPGDSYNLIV